MKEIAVPLRPPDPDDLWGIIAVSLAEDIGNGDITSTLIIPQDMRAEIQFVAKQDLIACGTFIPAMVYSQLSTVVTAQGVIDDGEYVVSGGVLAVASGPAQELLMGERVILNLMQHMSGIATLTRKYADAVKGTKAVILDTRKTLPGLRTIDKYAVRAGGGQNHRMRLDDMIMIKDNHIALAGNLTRAVERARGGSDLMVEVECDTLAQVKEALAAGPDRILLDNMPAAELREAVQLVEGKIPLEVSGGISLETVRAVAETGIDYISIGRLTHSAPAADIGAEISTESMAARANA